MSFEDLIIPELEELPDYEPTKRFWTEEEEAILQKYYSKKGAKALAKYLKRSVNSIEQKAGQIGLRKGEQS